MPVQINVLELRAFRLTLLHLEQEILGQTVPIESDNTAMVAYINKQGGLVSKTLNDWAIRRSLGLQAIH